MSHSANNPNVKLFHIPQLEGRDDFEEKMDRCFNVVSDLLQNISSERETNDILTKHVSIGNTEHEEVCLGLLVKILTDRHTAPKSFQNLMMVNRDSLGCIIHNLNIVILEKYRKLTEISRKLLVWLLKELIKSSANGCELLCISLMKQIVGGDTSPKNILLCENMLGILTSNQTWLEKSTAVVQTTVYTFLRLLQDHFHHNFTALRQKEVNLLISLMREKWLECCGIGRDLVRLLSSVARIPEMEKLWTDLLHKPQTLSPSFTGILSILQNRTSRKFLACRVTHDMETKISFMLHKVRFGHHKRYQEWFQRQYLSTAESQTLRSDLIRYICGCIHPSNDILCSDVIPRWAVIGWLLSTCTSRIASSYSNLSLFWDWLFYSPDKNSIMDIEPGILVMYQSIRSHPAMTTSLLDFLCRTMVEFHPPLASQIKQGVHGALRSILDKRVVQSLSPILDNPKLDPELRSLIRSNLHEFCAAASPEGKQVPSSTGEENASLPGQQSSDMIGEEPMLIDDGDSDCESSQKKNEEIELSQEGKFSDEEEQEQGNKKSKELPGKWKESPNRAPEDITADLERLDDTLRDLIQQLQETAITDLDERCERIQDIVDHVLSLDEFDTEVSSPLASCLTFLLSDHFQKSVLKIPSCDLTDEYLESSVEKPLHVLFRNLYQNQKDEDSFSVLLQLLSEMYGLQARLGYHLLFFLAVKKHVFGEDNMEIYESFAQTTQLGDTYNCLMMDVKHCQEDDVTMVVFLVPHIFKEFSDHCVGNSELLNIIVAVLDPQQLEELQCLIMMGELVMMKRDNVLNVILASLEWETFEQYCVWQLFFVHDISPEVVLPLVQKLNSKTHAEAISMMLMLFKRTKPTLEMVKHVISRQFEDVDRFATSLLRHWALEHTKELADHLTSLLTKTKSRNPPPRKGLRQR